MQALDVVTEPILQPIRQIMPRFGGIDLSPMVAIIVLSVISTMVRQSGI
jgi:YggT family protein